MKVQLLPSTLNEDGAASQRQHLACVVVDDSVALDAGSLAMSCSSVHRLRLRDIVLTHVHLDHIAGLPLYVDDLFSELETPVVVHASREMIEALERDIFNWIIYPRFSELENVNGPVLEYREFTIGDEFAARHLSIMPIEVKHNFPSVGLIASDGAVSIGLTGDTAPTDEIWQKLNETDDLAAVLVECAFPDEMSGLAEIANHLTPSKLASELEKFERSDVPVYVVNIKPMYRDSVIGQLKGLSLANVEVFEIGRSYEF